MECCGKCLRGLVPEQIDFVIVFALEKEFRAFLEQLGEFKVQSKDLTFARAEIRSKVDDRIHRLIAVQLPAMGNYEAATGITRAIDVWNPRFVLVGGIAGGVKQPGFELGDLVVADLKSATNPVRRSKPASRAEPKLSGQMLHSWYKPRIFHRKTGCSTSGCRGPMEPRAE